MSTSERSKARHSWPGRRWRGALGTTALAVLGACTVGPDFVLPAAPDAERYTSDALATATVVADGRAQRFVPGASETPDWWRLFRSAALDDMVLRSVARSPTLAAAEASLSQSQDNLRAGYGVFFPQIDLGYAASRQRSAPLQQGLKSSGSVFNVVTLAGTIGYVVDVFGGERRTVEGLQAQVEVQRNARRAAYLALTANVVNTCIARSAYAAQVRATGQLIELEEQQLRSTQAQVAGGMAAESSVLAVRALLAAHRALLAPLQQKLNQADHLLALLAGVTPSTAVLPEIELTGLAVPADLPVSLPSDLVRERPDILSAEAQLHLASAQVGVATAALFPSISLNGSFGVAAPGVADPFGTQGRFWSIGPSVAVPVFHGGSLWYGRKAALDGLRASEANYRQVVLTAFAQVADALNALGHDAEGLQAQDEAQRVAGDALRLLQANYGAGMVAYQDVLAADVQFHEAKINHLQAVAQREQDTVALLAALGGGWWNAPVPPEPDTAK